MSKEYRDTLNLPETDLSMKAGLPRKEPEILEFWNSINLYQKLESKMLIRKSLFFMTDLPMLMEIFIWVMQLIKLLRTLQ